MAQRRVDGIWARLLADGALEGHLLGYTPYGREVRLGPGGRLKVQPPHDNYWLRAPDLPSIRRAFHLRES